MTPSKVLFYFCISFILGIFFESLVKIPQIFVWGILFVAVFFIFASLAYRSHYWHYISIAGFCVLFLVLGILRVQITEFNIANDKLSELNDKPDKIVLTGIITAEPDSRDASQKLKVKVAGSTVLITTGKYPEYNYLERIKLTGKLKTPMIAEDFNYKNYLLKDGIYSVMDFPKIEIMGKAKPSFWQVIYSGILWSKQKLRQGIRNNFLPPHSSVLEGMILGDNSALTADLKTKLNITGLRHIIAVSGTHVVIISALLMSLLLVFGLYRGQAFYLSIFFLVIYIFLTGLPPSGIRAGIMGGFYLLGQKLGRQASSQRLIAIACAVMLLINPLLLIYDVGFQLSFLAVLGLIYLEPFLKIGINFLTKNKIEKVAGLFSTTLSAQIFTLPIMLYNFGNISLIAPITNLLALISVDLIMVFGFLSAIGGAIFYWLGWIFSIPCWILLEYFLKILDIFSAPWAIKTFENVSWIWIVILYIPIILISAFLHKKRAAWRN